MQIIYDRKKTEQEILTTTNPAELVSLSNAWKNKLIYGDNLPILKKLLETHKGKIDLIYVDPPFATNTDFRIWEDRVSTISSSNKDKIAYSDKKNWSEFLEFLRERLVFLRELLSEQGSIYLHIDYKIGHYVKIIMDEIFGIENFKNDITRIKCNPKNFSRKAYGNIKDLILFYTKSNKAIWNEPQKIFSQQDIDKLFVKTDEYWRKYTTIPLHAPGETINWSTGKKRKGILPPIGRHRRVDPKVLEERNQQGLIEWSKNGVPRKKIYADEKKGKKMQDIWEFKDPQYPIYPTEKNEEMLKSIVVASSNENSTVLDCFCGSGSSLLAAKELGRTYIWVDQSFQAIKTSFTRLDTVSHSLFDIWGDIELLSEKGKEKDLLPLIWTDSAQKFNILPSHLSFIKKSEEILA